MTNARALGEKIQTPAQAAQSLQVARETLRKAIGLVSDISMWQQATAPALTKAWFSRIEQQINRIGVLQKRQFSRTLANQAGLAVVQSAQLLGQLREEVAASRRGQIQQLLDDLAKALIAILAAGGKALAKAVPIPVTVIVAGLALVYLLGNTRRS